MTNVLKKYSTIAPGEVGESLYEDRKSQFFGFAVHAESADEAIDFRHRIIERMPNASHYVSAWVLADGAEFFSDAKEPHGQGRTQNLFYDLAMNCKMMLYWGCDNETTTWGDFWFRQLTPSTYTVTIEAPGYAAP